MERLRVFYICMERTFVGSRISQPTLNERAPQWVRMQRLDTAPKLTGLNWVNNYVFSRTDKHVRDDMSEPSTARKIGERVTIMRGVLGELLPMAR